MYEMPDQGAQAAARTIEEKYGLVDEFSRPDMA